MLLQELLSLREESQAKLKAYKYKDRTDLSDDDVWNFIEGQEVVTIEDFERRDGSIYFKPYFEDKFDEGNAAALGKAWRNFDATDEDDMVDESLTEARLHSDFDAFAPNAYGNGFDKSALVDGEVLTSSGGKHYAVVGISDDGKHLVVVKDDNSEKPIYLHQDPKRFGVVILPKGQKPEAK